MELSRIFRPKSVAIIGASLDERKRGFQAIKTLINDKYEGKIYPINPRIESVMGLMCYKNIMDIEDQVDLALITTPAQTMPSLLKECGEKGFVAGAVIIAGGFREQGAQGKNS